MATRALLLTGLALILGCGTKTPTAVVAKPTSGGGGAITPPVQYQTEKDAAGRNTLLQKPFDQVAALVLKKIGQEYRMALATGKPPKDKSEFETPLKTKRDFVDHEVEVLYGVDPSKLEENGAKHMLAWEKVADASGGRLVLMADCVTVNYLNEEAFKQMPKAK